MDYQTIRDVALQEVRHPTFALTRQFLAVNNVVFKEHVPVIEDVILDPQERSASVYFPIEGEQYYLLVVLALKPHVTVNSIAMSPGNRVYFAVTSETRSLEELLAVTGMEPTRIWRKGEKNGKLPLHSGFEIRPSEKQTGDVEQKLGTLLDSLLPFQSDMSILATLASAGISIAYYGYQEQMGGIYLDVETIGKLAQLHLSIDVDLYASGPALEAGR